MTPEEKKLMEQLYDSIGSHLDKIQALFKDAKVYLVVDNGAPSRSLTIGDADPERAIEIIRHMQDLPETLTIKKGEGPVGILKS